jgi:hypothetical protein
VRTLPVKATNDRWRATSTRVGDVPTSRCSRRLTRDDRISQTRRRITPNDLINLLKCPEFLLFLERLMAEITVHDLFFCEHAIHALMNILQNGILSKFSPSRTGRAGEVTENATSQTVPDGNTTVRDGELPRRFDLATPFSGAINIRHCANERWKEANRVSLRLGLFLFGLDLPHLLC